MIREPLPVDAVIPEVVHALGTAGNVVVEAPAGSGKTTRIPPGLLGAVEGGVIVLEPRRIAARMAARRVAQELGEPLGETAGYQVRFEEVAGPRTRLRFVTEGVLTRRLLSDGGLRGVGAVILDEFHERHLDGDVALALLRRLQTTSRPDLKLAVMSATLEAAPVAAYLGGCPVVRSEGRVFEVEVSYTPHSGAPLEEQVSAAVERLGRIDGDVLVFLPGAAEIRRSMRACEATARRLGLSVLPLHGDLSLEEQDRAVRRGEGRKLILSTNVAESSITIDGVAAVIDSGLARIASDSASTGLPTLEVRRISKASAAQRAGRAGRTAPGVAIRLYTLEDYMRRPEYDVPEIRRRDLSQAVLELRAMGVAAVPWFEPPPEESWRAAGELLDRLGGTEEARTLAKFPLHPRLSRMIVEAERRGVAREACRIAALLSSGERIERIDILDSIEGELPYRAQQVERQIRRMVRPGGRSGSDDDLRIAVLAAYPDRAGKRKNARDVRLSNGRPAILACDYAADLLVAIDIEDRKESRPPLIRAASAIKADWLLDLFPDRISEVNEVAWNRSAERVEGRSALLYDDLAIDESFDARPDPVKAGKLLADRALDAGLQRFTDAAALAQFLERVRFAAGYSDLRELTTADVEAALADLCTGLRSFAELERAARDGGLIAALRAHLGSERLLNEVAPERVALKQRQVRVHYDAGQPPWIESRLQDFFGIRDTPRIARGQVPLVVRLLAPNHRPVQTTTDLAGFWQRLYPQVRRELSRRYPKHAWPENPQ